MPTPSWTQSVDTIFTSTWSYRRKQAVEQAFLKTPFVYWMKKNGNVDAGLSGHTRLEFPLDYGEITAVEWIGRGDTVTLSDAELLTMGYENWKYVAATILRYGVDDQQNKGKAQLINYVTAKLNAAERALWKEFETRLLTQPSGGTAAKQPNGLENIIANDPTTGTLHGIGRATYTWFRNQSVDATNKPFGTYGVSLMRTMLNTITKYSGAEINQVAIVTTQTLYEAYEEQLLDYYRIIDKDMADAGFDALKYKGRTLMWSPFAPSNKMFFINAQYLKLMIDEGEFMQMTEWKPITNQVEDRVAHIKAVFNLVCTRPIAQGVIFNFTV